MNDLKFEHSIEELSMLELFDTIDNVDKSNDDNDKVIDKIKEQVILRFSSKLRKKREAEKRKAMYYRYKVYLEGFQELLKEQMTIINGLIEEDPYDSSAEFLDLKKNIIDYSSQAYKLDLLDMSEVLNKKEQRIYQCIHFYDFMKKYNTSFEMISLNEKQNINNNTKKRKTLEITSISSNWKTYFYLILSVKKQEEYNQKVILYFMGKGIKDDQFSKKWSDYLVADFQGQFSKNVYCQRKRLKLTQKQLEEKSGINRTMIAKIEKVQQPTTLETAIRILSSLDLGITIYPLENSEEKSFNG